MRVFWTKEQGETAKAMRRAGKMDGEIAEVLGKSKASIASWFHSLPEKIPSQNMKGLRKGETRWTEELLTKAAALWDKGFTETQVCAELGINSTKSFRTQRYKRRDLFKVGGAGRKMFPKTPKEKPKPKPQERTVVIRKRADEFFSLLSTNYGDGTAYVLPGQEPVRFFDTDGSSCKFLLSCQSATNGPDTMTCGRSVFLGSYCEGHAAIVYQPSNR